MWLNKALEERNSGSVFTLAWQRNQFTDESHQVMNGLEAIEFSVWRSLQLSGGWGKEKTLVDRSSLTSSTYFTLPHLLREQQIWLSISVMTSVVKQRTRIERHRLFPTTLPSYHAGYSGVVSCGRQCGRLAPNDSSRLEFCPLLVYPSPLHPSLIYCFKSAVAGKPKN